MARLFKMLAETLRELVIRCFLLELRESLHERLLGVQDVAELVQKQLARIAHLRACHVHLLVVNERPSGLNHSFLGIFFGPKAANRVTTSFWAATCLSCY